jgi:parvulin-like peptidyl-prolyl isomerase
MVDNALLVQFLTAQKIAYDPKAVDAQIAEVKAEYDKAGVNMADALAQLGLTEQKLRASVVAEAQWQNYLKKNVTDKQLAEYFAKYAEYYDGSEVRASHILVEVPPDADERTRTAAKAKAESIRKEVAGGVNFAEAAKKYSDCPSKEQGGDVDFFTRREKMVDPFAKAAFALKIGQLSSVVETEFGYHVILVTGRKPATRTKLDDPALRKDLVEAVGDVMKDEIVAKQRKVAKIEIAPGVQPPEQPKTKTATQPTGKTKK